MLRAGRMIQVLIGATIVVDWISVAAGADRPLWDGRTGALVASLAVLTLGWSYGCVQLSRLGRALPAPAGPEPDVDWLQDLAPMLNRWARRLPGSVGRIAEWLTAEARVELLRRRFVLLAGTASLLAGAAVAVALSREDGFDPAFFAIVTILFGGCSFAFALISNAVLELVKVPPVTSNAKALRVAAVAAGLALPMSLSLRDNIWNLLGRPGDVHTVGQLAAVTLGSALLASLLGFGGALAVRRPARP
jgi:hypothetical protein